MFKKIIILLLSFYILGYSFNSHYYVSPYPKDAYKITPPIIYIVWYTELYSCLKYFNIPISENNNFNDITWYNVPKTLWKDSDGDTVFGSYFFINKRIYFAEYYIPRKQIIKHELQHYFLRDFYDPLNEHPRPPFYFCEYF